jgi:ketosteroid isomerase-like protein
MTKTSDGLRTLVAAVPVSVPRATIEAAVKAFADCYASGDAEARIALFAENVTMEDPAGRVVATSRAQLGRFYAKVGSLGFDLAVTLGQMIVIGHEAMAPGTLRMKQGDAEPCRLALILHFVFDDAGLITSLRIFFDEAGITEG